MALSWAVAVTNIRASLGWVPIRNFFMIMACMYVLEMGIPATESLLGASINLYT
jgi:hypothetical protein